MIPQTSQYSEKVPVGVHSRDCRLLWYNLFALQIIFREYKSRVNEYRSSKSTSKVVSTRRENRKRTRIIYFSRIFVDLFIIGVDNQNIVQHESRRDSEYSTCRICKRNLRSRSTRTKNKVYVGLCFCTS